MSSESERDTRESERMVGGWVAQGVLCRGKYHICSIFMGKEGAWWLGRNVEENIVREGE